MPVCSKCNNRFPNWISIDDKAVNLSSRKYCLECSPRGRHNTKDLVKTKKPKCSVCGETDPDKFYGNKIYICAKCHNAYTIMRGRERKVKAVEYLGGRCIICGYNEFDCSLEFHHLNPEEKDHNLSQMKSWSWERQKEELDKCVILCSNCHHAFHSGLLELPSNI